MPLPVFAQEVDYGALEQVFGQTVTTSATGSPERESDVPVNMQIVTAEEIRRSGSQDIPGILKHVLGVDVMRWNSDNADVGIRGYDQSFSPRVLVLIDGRQVYADHFGYTPWAALPVELGAIRQIEVIRGPNAALFGFNAVNGVINIITYNPLYDDVNTASVTGGTQGTGKVSAVKTFKFKDGGVRLSASGGMNEDFSTPVPVSSGTLPRKRNDQYAIDIDGVFRLSSDIQLGLEVSHSAAATNNLSPVYSLSNDQHYASSIKGDLSADTSFGFLHATVYHNWLSQHSITSLPTALAFENEETAAQIQDLLRVGPDHIFRFDVEYRHNSVNTSPFGGADVFYDAYAASTMWAWDILPVLSLTSAVRWENLHLARTGSVPADYPFTNADWNHTVTEFHYSSGLVWKASEADTLRLIFSRGVQIPSLADYGAFLVHSPFLNNTGNPDVEGTDVNSYEIAWDRDLPMIGGKLRISAFSQGWEDFSSIVGGIVPGPGTPPYLTRGEVGSSIGRGLELYVTGKFASNWRWGANYRFESIADNFPPFASDGKSYIDFEHVTPKHMVKANLGWASGPWEIDSYFNYQSRTRGLESLPFNTGSFLSRVPDYFSMDARIAYRLTDWATLAVSGQNLGSASQKQTAAGANVERSVFATLTVNY